MPSTEVLALLLAGPEATGKQLRRYTLTYWTSGRSLNDHTELPWNIPHQVKTRVRPSWENDFNII